MRYTFFRLAFALDLEFHLIVHRHHFESPDFRGSDRSREKLLHGHVLVVPAPARAQVSDAENHRDHAQQYLLRAYAHPVVHRSTINAMICNLQMSRELKDRGCELVLHSRARSVGGITEILSTSNDTIHNDIPP